MKRFLPAAVLFSIVALYAAWFVAFNHGGSTTRVGQSAQDRANVVISVSDSALCAAPSGPYAHIYVTFAGVAASTDATAATTTSNLVDLAPQLREEPAQIDLLGEPDNNCILAILGRGAAPPGAYKLLRISLLQAERDVAAIPGGNHCGGAAAPTANCVVTREGAVLPLALPPDSSFDIGPEEMPDGQIVVLRGGTTQLNISMSGCDSVVSLVGPKTPGSYTFVASARAAVLDKASAISGRVIDADAGKPIDGRVVVALERKDATGIDRIVMATTAAADGGFVLCPVPPGSYDLATSAVSNARFAYAPTLLLGVPAGSATGAIGIVRAGTMNAAPATVIGQVSLLAGSTNGFGRIRISALASGEFDGTDVTFTVPLPASAAGTLLVAGPGSIPYSFTVPAANPRIGRFSADGMDFEQGTSKPPAYTVEAKGCGMTKTTASPVTVTAGGTASAPILTIASCGPG
jgi:hypothetical protein